MKFLSLLLVVMMSAVTVQASERMEAIKQKIYSKKNDFTQCYDNLLHQKRKTTDGKVVLVINIGELGDVILVQINEAQSTLKDIYFWGCLVDTAKKWTFTAGKEKQIVQVSYPVVFNSKVVKKSAPKELPPADPNAEPLDDDGEITDDEAMLPVEDPAEEEITQSAPKARVKK